MADDDLRRREAEVASKEKQLKEYSLMKGEWASLKSKVASADTRLASANKELESKETYIRKLIKKDRDTSKTLSDAQSELSRLRKIEEVATFKEKELQAAAEQLKAAELRAEELEKNLQKAHGDLTERANAVDEAKKSAAQFSVELDAMRHQQYLQTSATAEKESVREAEVQRLQESLAAAAEDQRKAQSDLKQRSLDLSSALERERSLETALDARAQELEAAKEECRVLQGHVGAREAADRKAAEAAADAKRVAAQAEAESVARAAAEQEMQEMANQLKSMAVQVASLESKERQEEEARAAAVTALSDELASATRESRALTNRLEEHRKELEQTKAALQAANAKLDDNAGHQAAFDLAQVREDALQREIEALKKELASSKEALLGLKESAARVEALTQTATELRDDLEAQESISRHQAQRHASELAQLRAAQDQSSAALVCELKELQERAEWLETRLQEASEAAVQEAERASAAEQSVVELEEMLEEVKSATHDAEAALQESLERAASKSYNDGAFPVNEEQQPMADSLLGNLGSTNTATEPYQANEQRPQQQEKGSLLDSSKKTSVAEKSVQTVEVPQQEATIFDGLESTNVAVEPTLQPFKKQYQIYEEAYTPEPLVEIPLRKSSEQMQFQESEDEPNLEPAVDDANALANVWDLVEDFLHSAGTVHTLECLASERSIVAFKPTFSAPSSKEARHQSQCIVESLLKAFDEGRAADFSDLWAKHVPPSLTRPPRSSTNHDSVPNGTNGEAAAAAWAQRVLVKAHAHFALLPLRQRLRRAQWAPSGSMSSPKKGRGTVSLPTIPQAQPRSSMQRITNDHSGGNVMPAPMQDSALEAFPADAAESRAMEHFRTFLSSSDSAATGDPELLPLLALPQLPRPWQHPSLAAVLKLPDNDNNAYDDENVAANASSAARAQEADTLMLSRGPQAAANFSAVHAGGPWVVSLRRELVTLLETRLLLARPPRLLALHRAYSTWQSVLKDRFVRASRSAATLREVSGELVGLCVELLQALDANVPGASSTTFARHRRRLNALRRTWQNESSEDAASVGAQEVAAPPLYGAALKRRLEALLSMTSVTRSREDEPLNRLLLALGDRLSYSTVVSSLGYEPARVRRQTTDDLITGDVLSLFQTSHSTDSYSTKSNATTLLDSSRDHGAAAMRVVALLALRPEGRHYLTTARLPHLLAALTANLSPEARLGASCAACVALSHLLPGKHTAAAAVADAAANAQLLPTLIVCLRRTLTMPSSFASTSSPTSSTPSVFSPPAEALLGQGSVLLVLCGQSRPTQRWCAGELAIDPLNAPEQHHPSADEEATDVVAELADLFHAALESLDRHSSSARNNGDDSTTVATSTIIEGVARCVLGCFLCLVQAHPALRQRAAQLNLTSRWRGHASLSADLEWQLECVAKAAAASSGKEGKNVRSRGDADTQGSDQEDGELNSEDEEAAFEMLEIAFGTRSDTLTFEGDLKPYYMSSSIP